ncbi:YcjF family protein [Lapidilactobacillus achengensis]|uniref:YcjF family protein n=1 Tax=Lapidilactobacillus achengensis TaxID=2486000 RepID=A0ABW1UM66_9LACO|nr:GTPase [Lapidilactobacillus achengensis]
MSDAKEYQQVVTDTLNKFKKDYQNLSKINIVIAGKTGIGKSTLINAAFGQELAETGIGSPITDKINFIQAEGFPVQIYDTVGLEMSAVSQWKSLHAIKELIRSKRKTETEADDIHCVWYCVNASGSRIESQELKYIQQFQKLRIPVILVLTKSFSRVEADKLGAEAQRQLPSLEFVSVLAKATDSQGAFGIQELVELTANKLPEALQTSFSSAQKASLLLKRKQGVKVINSSIAATFTTGFVPIPVADAPLMMATQSTMLAKLTVNYGIDPKTNQIETAIAGALGIFAALSAGKTTVSAALKSLPGVGTVAGGLISGSVGGAMTGALGYAYMNLMEQVALGKVDLSAMSSTQLTELLTESINQLTNQFLNK